jgi:hypothetical protein
MAKQDSLLKFKGAIEDLAFFKSRDGYQVRKKSGVSGERIQNDPAFQRTRENGAEFGRSARVSKYIRTAMRSMLQNGSGSRTANRLTSLVMQILKTDTTSARGQRNVLAGDIGLLNGFEFNDGAFLTRTFFAPYSSAIDRASGGGLITIQSFNPEDSLRPPEGSTHIRFVSGMTAIDFETGESQFAKVASAELLLTAQSIEAISLTPSLPAVGSLPLFLLLGMEFFQEVNGRFYALRNGAYNALSIVNVNVAA